MGKRVRFIFLKVGLWLLVANALVAMGVVLNIQKSLWLPEYGQGFWWAWGSALIEAPENVLFIVLGLIAFIVLATKKAKVYASGGKG